jgi:hypothetical protein
MESYCPHCEDWHEGSCQKIPKDRPLYPIDTDTPDEASSTRRPDRDY